MSQGSRPPESDVEVEMEGPPFLELLIKEQADAKCSRRTRMSELSLETVSRKLGP